MSASEEGSARTRTEEEEEEDGGRRDEELSGISSEHCSPTDGEDEKEDDSITQSREQDSNMLTEDEKRFLAQNLPLYRSREEEQLPQHQQRQEKTFTQKDLFNQLPETVRQELDNCTGWAITRVNSPEKFVIAKRESNQILDAGIKEHTYRTKKGKEAITVFRLVPTNVLINSVPLEVTEHLDPLIKEIGPSSPEQQQHQYTIKFRTTKGECFTLSYMSLSDIFRELDHRALVVSSHGAEKALNSIVNSFKDLDKMKINKDINTPGFYLIDGKLVMAANAINAPKHPMPTKKQMVECIELIDTLYTKFFNRRPELLPTFVKWGMMAPWSFILKQLKCPFMSGLLEYGSASSAKTTLGKFALSIYGFYAMNNMEGIPFEMANTPARLGEIASIGTYAVLINEIGSLGTDTRLHNLIELLKTLRENIQARGGFFNMNGTKRSMSLVPALCNLILTGNPPPPSDTGFQRRYIPIPYSTTDQLDPTNPAHAKKMEDFTNLFNDNRHKLKYLGDWVVNYILNQNPDLLLNINKPISEGGSSGNWQNAVKTMIKEAYNYAEKESPSWIDLYVTMDQIAESKEDLISILRTFLIESINNLYTRHLRTFEISDSDQQTIITNRSLGDRFEWLLSHNLIPYIESHGDNNKDVVIYKQILEDLKAYKGNVNNNIPTMEDIATFLGFKYTQLRMSNGRPHVIRGSLDSFKSFLCPTMDGNNNDV